MADINILSDATLKALKAADDGSTIKDGGNLYGKVRAKAGGAVSVSFAYRYKFDGKQKEVACGTYPAVSLKNIRLARNAARTLLEQGTDPAARKKAEKLETRVAETVRITEAETILARMTVRQLYARWVDTDLATRKDGGAETKRGLEKDMLPALGDKCAADVTRADVMAVVDAIIKRGANRLANRVLSEMRQMFHYGKVREIVAANPTESVKKKDAGGAEEERERVLSVDELRALPAALQAAEMLDASRHALLLVLGTNARIGEVVKARKTDIDLDARTWRIPIANSKNTEPHRVYLSDFALFHMRKLLALSKSKIWLLPARFKEGETENHIDTKAITKQVGDRQLKFADREPHKGRSVKHANALVLVPDAEEKWTPHDLRRTAASLMQEAGVLPVVIDKCLNHVDENKVRRTYQRYDYAAEQREAWIALGTRLEVVLSGGNVIIGNFATA